MLLQIKLDNTMLYNQLVRAFSEVGTNRLQTGFYIFAYHHIKQTDKQAIMSACPSIELDGRFHYLLLYYLTVCLLYWIIIYW